MILVDTSVLSAALRYRRTRTRPREDAEVFRQMLAAGVAPSVPGVVIQEILSGIREEAQFERLKDKLEGLPVVLAQVSDHVAAAALLNACRRRGLVVTLVDCLIAAQAISNSARLWTLDHDFARIAQHSDLKLFTPR